MTLTEEKLLIRKTVQTWISVGMTPANILEGIADAFLDPTPLIDSGYEVFGHQREKTEDSLRSIAQEIRSYGWD
jgi:hypothetical protein